MTPASSSSFSVRAHTHTHTSCLQKCLVVSTGGVTPSHAPELSPGLMGDVTTASDMGLFVHSLSVKRVLNSVLNRQHFLCVVGK